MQKIILLFLVCITFPLFCQGVSEKWASVFITDSDMSFKVVPYKDPQADAYASFLPITPDTGFAQLTVYGNGNKPSDSLEVAYAMGVVESYLTNKMIFDLWCNSKQLWFPGPHPSENPKVRDWLSQQSDYLDRMVSKYSTTDPYWKEVAFVRSQGNGLIESYSQFANETSQLEAWELRTLLYAVDMMDLVEASNVTFSEQSFVGKQLMKEKQSKRPTHHGQKFNPFAPSCSAFVKSFKDGSVATGHTTWGIYLTMIRIVKTYRYENKKNDPNTPGWAISFSSYPGTITSNDDFMVTNAELIVTETTLNVYNTSLYKRVTPKCVLSYMRGIIANRMSSSSEQWGQVYSRYVSGTQNNEWIVVDLKKINSGSYRNYPKNSVMIFEQMPSLIKSKDVTDFINSKGYWGSYNIPYDTQVWTDLGYKDMEHKFGPDDYSWSDCARAKIFNRNQSLVTDIKSTQRIMRLNDYLHDPLSKKNPEYAIADRSDLADQPFIMGGIDTKVISSSMYQNNELLLINGPTQQSLKPFDFSMPQFSYWKHYGIPDVCDYPWFVYDLFSEDK
ncbi:phospholipase b-related [Anaeramoeba flamelloides]|uniref:Phospholipase B-like n=1 Tax=Anaeramoeba flamelloides TaxID=1746091 RepID=A0ABQ8Y4Q0_9EUKA|nr:phospholipase b-related [Anaeramoeba flamelloides]